MWRLYLILMTLQTLQSVTDSALIDGKPFELELQKVADDALGVSEMQKSYDRLSNTSVKLDGEKIVGTISSSMSRRFSGLLSALVDLKDAVEQYYDSSTMSTTLPECCSVTGTHYDTRFRSEINFAGACYAKSSSIDQSTARYPLSAVEQVMKKNYDDNSNLLWQYFGSETGTYINYPSVKLSNCDYDPRFRPYYASGSSPKPKDVVITIDTSSSMSQPAGSSKTLMQIAKEAAITVIKTLNPNDRVGIVSFNDEATRAHVTKSGCFSNQLAMATAENTKTIITYVNSLSFNGGTNYEKALRASFKYFNQSDVSLQGEERDSAILFLTDGGTVAGADPLLVISEENGLLNNKVIILTYGLGSQLSNDGLSLLRNMSLQTLNDPSKGDTKFGIFEHIQNPVDLVSRMGSYYNFLSKGKSEATFTVPYKDAFSKIGLLTSVCLPAFYHGKLIGVVCMDIKISDLKSEMSVLENDEQSYSFLIDGYGRTLVHPLLPLPWSVSDDVVLLDVAHFEKSLTASSIDQMKRGQDGETLLQNTRTLPRGQVLQEGITTKMIFSRYYWKQVPNANYTVCIVIGGEGIKHVPAKKKGKNDIFSYHITRLGSDTLSRCRHFGRYATKDKSLIMLTPSAFKEPYKYLDSPETEATVATYENYFQGKTTNDETFKDTVLTSMVVTHDVEPLWIERQKEASYVIWRYIATVDGIVRMYPGVEIKKDYDPKLRPWYWRSIAQKGQMVISAPYRDAWGSGYLITLSKTIFEGRSDNLHNNPSAETVTAVMGTDFPIYFFYHLLLKQYPVCSDATYSCFVIDTSGFIVIHKDFTTVYTDPQLDDLYHITNKEGRIARDLIFKGVLTKRTCTDYQTVKDQLTYRVGLTNFYKDGIDTLSSGDTYGYEMRPIQNTNIFLLIKRTSNTKSPCCGMQISPSLLRCKEDPTACECLCYREIAFDYCRNEYISSDSSPTCSAPAPKYDSVFKEEEIKIRNLDTCFETKCEERSTAELCYNVAGCSFCVQTASGSKTKPPFCALKEICPFGKCAKDSNCNKGDTGGGNVTTSQIPTTNPDGSEGIGVGMGIGLGCGAGVTIIVILLILILRRRASKDTSSDYITAVDVNHVNGGGHIAGPYIIHSHEFGGYVSPITSNQTSDNVSLQNTVNKEKIEMDLPPPCYQTNSSKDSGNSSEQSGSYAKVKF